MMTPEVPEALDELVRQRLKQDHDAERRELVGLLGEDKYNQLINTVIKPAACKMEYRITEHFQMTATTLRDVGDFLRHMLAEGFAPDTDLTEPVTFWVDYTRDVRVVP